MEGHRTGKGDLLGILAAAWIGGLGGLFVGAIGGSGTTLIPLSFAYYGGPEGYYASGTVYGFVGGAFVGCLAGLAAGAVVARHFGNRRVALLGGICGIVAAAAYGLLAYGLAVVVELAFLGDAILGGVLGAAVFAAAGGVLAVAIRSGSPGTGTRAALQDVIAGGMLGSFLGMLGGGFAELAVAAWVVPARSGSMNEGLFFGFYLGAAVGAAVAVVVGTIIRRWRSRTPPPEEAGKVPSSKIRLPRGEK